MADEITPPSTESLRERAVRRLKKQRDFKVHLLMYAMVNILLVVIWAMTGAPFFWPGIVMVGWGIGVVANAYDAYGRDVPTESQIEREVEKLRHDR